MGGPENFLVTEAEIGEKVDGELATICPVRLTFAVKWFGSDDDALGSGSKELAVKFVAKSASFLASGYGVPLFGESSDGFDDVLPSALSLIVRSLPVEADG